MARTYKTRYLGVPGNRPVRRLDLIPFDKKGQGLEVQLDCTEFTSHCPVTGAPDFGRVLITYWPDKCLVETKSVKMWLWSFRSRKGFNEAMARDMCEAFWRQVKPFEVTIEAQFNHRGGIGVTAKAHQSRDD